MCVCNMNICVWYGSATTNWDECEAFNVFKETIASVDKNPANPKWVTEHGTKDPWIRPRTGSGT